MATPVTPPTVRGLNDLVAELTVGIQPQRDFIQGQIAENQKFGEAQEAGLNAAQTRAFRDIEGRAQDKGALFSGFTPDAQATYTAEHYLPALARLQQQIAATRGQLMGESVKLGTDVFNKAFDTRSQDEQNLFQFNMQEDQQQFTSGENKLDRDLQKEMQKDQQAFDKLEAEIQRAWESGESAKARALEEKLALARLASDEKIAAMSAAASRYSADRGYASDDDKITDADRVSGVKTFFQETGGEVQNWDGRVKPETFAAARQGWIASGGTAADFNAAFSQYADIQGNEGSDGKFNYNRAQYGIGS